MKKFTSIMAAIMFSFLWLIAFYFIYAVSSLLFALIFTLLTKIPIVKTLIAWLFRIREDSPDMVMMMIAPTLAYSLVGMISGKMVKNDETRRLSLLFTGICLIVLNILFCVVNLINNAAILANIIIAITGVIFVIKNKKDDEEYN